MGILEDGLARIIQSRLNRIESESKPRSPYQIATYQGKSLVDGSDIIQVGANEPVSGFKLTANASLGIGEKVSLRPNSTNGLQRVDARNVALPTGETAIAEEKVYAKASLLFIRILVLGSPIYSEFYAYPLDNYQKWSTNNDGTINKFILWITKFQPSWAINNYGLPLNPSNVIYTYSLTSSAISLQIVMGANTVATAFFFNVTINYDATFADLLTGVVNEYPFQFGVPNPSSIIEAEFTPSVGILSQIQLVVVGYELQFECAVNVPSVSIGTVSGAFRYRKRGATNWFELA